jgi:hypothetical protein
LLAHAEGGVGKALNRSDSLADRLYGFQRRAEVSRSCSAVVNRKGTRTEPEERLHVGSHVVGRLGVASR